MFSISKTVAVMQSFYLRTVPKILVFVFIIAEHFWGEHLQCRFQQGRRQSRSLYHKWWQSRWLASHLLRGWPHEWYRGRCVPRYRVQASILDEIHLVATTTSGTKVMKIALSVLKGDEKPGKEDKIKLMNNPQRLLRYNCLVFLGKLIHLF